VSGRTFDFYFRKFSNLTSFSKIQASKKFLLYNTLLPITVRGAPFLREASARREFMVLFKNSATSSSV